MAIDPVHPSTLYAWGNQQGLMQSVDSGETWTLLDQTLTPYQLLVDSNSTLYAVSGGAIYVRSGDAFIKKVAPGSVSTLVLDPTNLSTWYATTYANSGAAIYKSTDRGDTWQLAVKGLPNLPAITSLALDPSAPQTLYVGLGATSDGFFAKLSPDGATLQYSTYLGGASNDSVRAVAVDAAGNAYLAGTTSSTDFPMLAAFRTSGGGFAAKFDANNSLVWSSSLGIAAPNAIAFGPGGDLFLTGGASSASFATPNALNAFLTGDLFRTMDGGANWIGNTVTNNQSVSAIVVDPVSAAHIFALADRVYASTDRGQNWMPLGMPGFSNKLFINPQDDSILYATGFSGVWKSTDGGATWIQKQVIPNAPFVPIFGLAIDSKTPSTLYAPSLPPLSVLPPNSAPGTAIFKSTDAGETWSMTGSPQNPIAITFDPQTSTLYGSFAVNSTAPGPTGIISKSTDGGATWTTVINGLPAAWEANILVADPVTSGRVYALGSFFTNDLYRTDDGGNNWMQIGAGLPTGWQITALAADPNNPAVVYAASAAGGLYRSSDAGANFTVVPGLSIPGVNFIAIDPSDSTRVYAGASANPQDAFVMRIAQ